MIERRREQGGSAVPAAHQVRAHGVHRALGERRGTAADSTAHDWAIESIRHSSFCAEPSGVPSS